MEELSCAGRDYLEAMLLLEGSMETVRSVDLARAMGVTRASVCRAVGSLCESGFLVMEGRVLRLTETGKAAAMANHEKQLFFEPMLQAFSVAAAAQATASIMWVAILIVIYAVEIMVAAIQAYVFALLSAVYIQLAENDEH